MEKIDVKDIIEEEKEDLLKEFGIPTHLILTKGKRSSSFPKVRKKKGFQILDKYSKRPKRPKRPQRVEKHYENKTKKSKSKSQKGCCKKRVVKKKRK